jgi:hypothetical protein
MELSRASRAGRSLQDGRAVVSYMLPDLATASRHVLSAYLCSEGFEIVVRERTHVEYVRGDVVLIVEYWPEDLPPRPLNVALGINYADGRQAFALDELAPVDCEGAGFTSGRFSDDIELEHLLVSLRDFDLVKRATPYWRDKDRLVQAVHRLALVREEEHQGAVARRQLDAARKAFAEGRYPDAIDRFVMVGGELSPADRQRLKIARRERSTKP